VSIAAQQQEQQLLNNNVCTITLTAGGLQGCEDLAAKAKLAALSVLVTMNNAGNLRCRCHACGDE
jgi:hypothetical protein